MKALSVEEFSSLVITAGIKPKPRQELRFAPENIDWQAAELVPIYDRSGNKGILLCDLDGDVYITPYELSKRITTPTGQSRPIVCDFCATWQPGTGAARITFTLSKVQSRTFLCCADLQCAQHARAQTPAARTSRAQLREDITPEQRIQRLVRRLQALMQMLQVTPISIPSHSFSD